MPNLICENIFVAFKIVNVYNFLHNDTIIGCKTAHGFIMDLKSFELTRLLKGQDVRPN